MSSIPSESDFQDPILSEKCLFCTSFQRIKKNVILTIKNLPQENVISIYFHYGTFERKTITFILGAQLSSITSNRIKVLHT